jgi:3-deoxy-D-manno-octulosonic acid kinase
MKIDGGRIATDQGAMLADSAILGNASVRAAPEIFDPGYWAARQQCEPVAAGRGAAWFVGSEQAPWVLRHYRRGGLMARLSADKYWWYNEVRVRAFAEWRLLKQLHARGLPVPAPVAAAYRRSGATYQCDLLTERIVDAPALSTILQRAPVPESTWRAIGATVARFHQAGVFHADLNAHNILVQPSGLISVIDFDRGRLREPGAWALHNLQRLNRSLRKIGKHLPERRFTETEWQWLLAGYG